MRGGAAGGHTPVVLILRALGLGDFLAGLPALKALARAFPDHRRILAAPAPLEPLVRLSGTVHSLLPTAPLAPVDWTRPEVAVNLHGRGPESHRLLLATEPGRLLAFRNGQVPGTDAFPEWTPDEHEVRRWCRLLRGFGVPADPRELALPAPGVPAPAGVRGALLIHPGASHPARRWPADRWATLARMEKGAGQKVALTAGPGEDELAYGIAEAAGLPRRAVLTGLDLEELAAAVSAAERVVSGDTGVAHLATALDRPSVVIFGPVPPTLWGPPPGKRHRVLWAGRTGDPHAGEPGRGLLEISPEQVAVALRQVA